MSTAATIIYYLLIKEVAPLPFFIDSLAREEDYYLLIETATRMLAKFTIRTTGSFLKLYYTSIILFNLVECSF